MVQKAKTIGALSKRTGVKVTTIRYYESIGLMSVPDRSASGQRIYTEDAAERLNFIRHARELGFSMDVIRELIKLQMQPSKDCAVVDEIARRNLTDVRHRLSQLKALEKELEAMISACAGGAIGSCAVLGCLSDHEQCLSGEHEKIDLILKSQGS